jgi:uncharacterized membrane protein
VVATLYNWLKSFHVLMAVIWVGGNVALQIVATRVNRSGNKPFGYELTKQYEFIGTRVFTPVSLILVVLGVWMVGIGPWNFGMLWIDLGIAMFAFSFVSGAFYLGPHLKKLKETADREGLEAPAVDRIIRNIFVVSRIELALLILIVFDMVLKPGA